MKCFPEEHVPPSLTFVCRYEEKSANKESLATLYSETGVIQEKDEGLVLKKARILKTGKRSKQCPEQLLDCGSPM